MLTSDNKPLNHELMALLQSVIALPESAGSSCPIYPCVNYFD